MSEQIDWSKAPADATHGSPAVFGQALVFYKDINAHGYLFSYGHVWKKGRGRPCGTPLIERPATPPWNGPEDGLPPVGLEVEVFDDREPHFSYAMRIGQRVRIVAHDVLGEGDDEGTPVAVYAFNHPKGEGYHALVAGKFRPIRTAEQLAAEERSKACDKMYGVILSLPKDRQHNRSDICEALYDAGARMPGEGRKA